MNIHIGQPVQHWENGSPMPLAAQITEVYPRASGKDAMVSLVYYCTSLHEWRHRSFVSERGSTGEGWTHIPDTPNPVAVG